MHVSRPGERMHLTAPQGEISYERLTPGRGDLEVLSATMAPGSVSAAAARGHESTECLVVLEGEVVAEIDGERMVLVKGESVTFDSRLPHRFCNESTELALVPARRHPTDAVTGSVSLGFQTDKSAADYARLAVMAESLGFDGVSVFHDLGFQPSLFPLLEMARVTSRIRLGSACLNAFLLHPSRSRARRRRSTSPPTAARTSASRAARGSTASASTRSARCAACARPSRWCSGSSPGTTRRTRARSSGSPPAPG